MFSAALCDLPAGDDVASELSEADVNKLRMDCFYADPATDRPAIVGAMARPLLSDSNGSVTSSRR